MVLEGGALRSGNDSMLVKVVLVAARDIQQQEIPFSSVNDFKIVPASVTCACVILVATEEERRALRVLAAGKR